MPRRPTKKTVPILMQTGMETGTDPNVLGGWNIVENAIFDLDGAIEKRNGQDRCASSLSGAHTIAPYRDGLLVLGDESSRIYDRAENDLAVANQFDGDMTHRSCKTSFNDAVAGVGGTSSFGAARVSYVPPGGVDHYVVAYDELQTLSTLRARYVLVSIDATTGSVIDTFNLAFHPFGNPTPATYGMLKVLPRATGGVDVYHIAYNAVTDYRIYRSSTGADGTFGSTNQDTGVQCDGGFFDVCETNAEVGSTSDVILAAATATNIVLHNLTTAGGPWTAKTLTGGYAWDGLTVYSGTGVPGVGSPTGNTVGVIGAEFASSLFGCTVQQFDSTTGTAVPSSLQTVKTATTDMRYMASAASTIGAKDVIYLTFTNDPGTGSYDYKYMETEVLEYGTTTISSKRSLHHVGITSDLAEIQSPSIGTGQWGIVLTGPHFPDFGDSAQRQYYLCVANDSAAGKYHHDVVSRFGNLMQESLNIPLDMALQRGSVISLDATQAVNNSASFFAEFFYRFGSSEDYIVRRATFSLDQKQSVESVSSSILLSGSCPRTYDGNIISESGFNWYPELVLAAPPFTGGSMTADSERKYRAVYLVKDANGVSHRSSPTPLPCSVTPTGSTLSAKILVPRVSLTSAEGVDGVASYGTSELYIELYRTVDSANQIYHRVAIQQQDRSNPFTQFIDGTSDFTASAYRKLYTQGGVLSNAPPPPYLASTFFQGRHFVVNEEDRTEVRYSKFVNTGAAPEYNENLSIKADSSTGPITALGSLSDKLIIFKENEIWATEGEGLSDNGFGAGYIEPYLLNTSIGCTSRFSVAQTPPGLMFLAEDGIWLLDLGLNAVNIGEPATYYTENYTITGVAVDTDRSMVIWTTNGPAIAYNYTSNAWSTWTNYDSLGIVQPKMESSDSPGTISPVTELVRLDSSGYVWHENTGTYVDKGATTDYVTMKLRSGAISWAQIGGYWRLWKLFLTMTNKYDHTLRIKLAYDGVPAWADNLTFDSSTLQNIDRDDFFGGGLALNTYRDQAYLVDVVPSQQKGTSLILEISDEQNGGGTPNDASAGFIIHGITALVGTKSKTLRTGGGRVIGV